MARGILTNNLSFLDELSLENEKVKDAAIGAGLFAAGGVGLPTLGGYAMGNPKTLLYPIAKGANATRLAALGAQLGTAGAVATSLPVLAAAALTTPFIRGYEYDTKGTKDQEMAEIRYMKQLGYLPAGEGKWMDANTGEIASDREIENLLAHIQEKEGMKQKYLADLQAAENIAYDQGRIAETRDRQLNSALDDQTNLSRSLAQAEARADDLMSTISDELLAKEAAKKQYEGAKTVIENILPASENTFTMPKSDSLKALNTLMDKSQIEDMALNTIRGVYGNGQARKDALGENYKAIQTRVNEILASGK